VRSSQKSPKLNSSSGMTMIELLVGTVIAFIIITPLMGMVIGLLNDDSREQAKATTDEEINSALQYISDDISQATYIYDKKGITALLNQGANAIIPAATADSTPILVFVKRTLVENAIPPGNTTTVGTCNPGLKSDDAKNANCDDAFVLSLVAYYLETPPKPTNSNPDPFCPNDGGDCPARITRFEIQDGVKNISQNYVCGETNTNPPVPACNDNSQKRDDGFPKSINTSSITTLNSLVRETGENINLATNPIQVLVNYIDISTLNIPATATCNVVLGVTTPEKLTERGFPNAAAANIAMLRTTPSNSFYACVDSHANVAQIYLRGNALRRIQKDANYSPNSPALFPTATMQMRGLSTFGSQ
ncbi:MAG: hormogonium polysaccharide secretion pseudopilin HpsC, partial [Planktothrix sp.]